MFNKVKFLALTAILSSFLAAPLQAAILSDFFGSAIASKSDTYDSGSGLTGTVLSAVFSKSVYDTTFTGATVFGGFTGPAAGELAYIYQIINDDAPNDAVSSTTVLPINNSATSIGDVRIDAGDMAPQVIQSVLIAGNSATWGFNGVGNNILAGGVSTGLVLTSTNLPVDIGIEIVVNGGGSGFAGVLVPGNISIPEPSSLFLLGLGSSLALLRRCRR